MPEALWTWTPVIVAAVAAIPLAGLVVVLLARHRIRAGRPNRAWPTAISEVGIAVGTAPWIWMILTPRPGPGGVELVPGRGLVEILAGDHAVAVVQIGGNLLVFAAFGFFLPLRWRLGLVAIAGYAAAGSVTVEIMQYALHLGRVSSVDDVMLNTLGAVLAAGASRCWWLTRPVAQMG